MARHRAWTAPGRLEGLPHLQLLREESSDVDDDGDEVSFSSYTISDSSGAGEPYLVGLDALRRLNNTLGGQLPSTIQDDSATEAPPAPPPSPTGLGAFNRLNSLSCQPPATLQDDSVEAAVQLSSPVPVPPAPPPSPTGLGGFNPLNVSLRLPSAAIQDDDITEDPPAPKTREVEVEVGVGGFDPTDVSFRLLLAPTGRGGFNPRDLPLRLPSAAIQDDNITEEPPAPKTREVEVGVGGFIPRNVPFQLQPAPAGRGGFNPRDVPLRLPAPPLSAVGHGGFNPRDVPLRSPPAHIHDDNVNEAPPAPPPSPAGLGGFNLPSVPFRLQPAPAGRGGFNPLNVPLQLLPAPPPNPTGAGSFNPLNVPFRLPLAAINGDPIATPPTDSTFLDLYHRGNLPETASKTLLTLAPPLPKTLAFSHRTQLEECGAYEELNGGYVIPEWSEEYYQAEQQQLAFYDGHLGWKRERQRAKEDAGATWWRVVDGREVREEGMPYAGLVREEPLGEGLRGVERRGLLREGTLGRIVEEGPELDSHVNIAAVSSSAAAASLAANIRPGATPRTNRTNNANRATSIPTPAATPAAAAPPPSPTPSEAETAWFHALFATLEEHDTEPAASAPTSRPGHIELDVLGAETWVDDHSLTGLGLRLPRTRIRTPPPRLALLNEPQLAESLSAILTGETGTSLNLHPSSRIYQPGPAPDLEPPAPTTTGAASRHNATTIQPFAAAPVSAAPATKNPPTHGPPARSTGVGQPWSLAAFEAGRRDRKGRRGWGEGVVGFGNRALGKEWERDQVLRDWERRMVGQRRVEREMVAAAAAVGEGGRVGKKSEGGRKGEGMGRRNITPGDEVRERVALLRARARAEVVEREVLGEGEGETSGDSWASIR